MKKFFVLLLSAALLFCLVGCQSNTKSEKEIKADVLANVETFEKHNVSITNFEITNRKTDTGAKIDAVYGSVAGENDILKCSASFVVTYKLYDQGWLFEDIELSDKKVVPTKSTITKEIALKDFEEHNCYEGALEEYRRELGDYSTNLKLNLSFDKEELNLEDGRHKFYFVDHSAKIMCILHYDFSFKWSFDGIDHTTFSEYEDYYGPYN